MKHTVHWLYCSGCCFLIGSDYLHIEQNNIRLLARKNDRNLALSPGPGPRPENRMVPLCGDLPRV